MRARISMGDMSCMTPNPAVNTNGSPRLMKKIEVMESGNKAQTYTRLHPDNLFAKQNLQSSARIIK